MVASLGECSTRGQVLTRLGSLAAADEGSGAGADSGGGKLLAMVTAERPELARAVDWARARAQALGEVAVTLEGGAGRSAISCSSDTEASCVQSR